MNDLNLPALPEGYRWRIKRSIANWDDLRIEREVTKKVFWGKPKLYWEEVVSTPVDREQSDYKNEVLRTARYLVTSKFPPPADPKQYRGVYYTNEN